MQTLNSYYRPLSAVQFPAYRGTQVYMASFDASDDRLPSEVAAYTNIAKTLLADAGITSGQCHMTVDEKIVRPGMSQRRPGPHVDGCFYPEQLARGHEPGPAWAHFCNNVPVRRMPVIVAASVAGCRAWSGEYSAQPSDCGDLSHVPLGDGELLPANRGYLLGPDCIHESLIFDAPTKRQFVRIALPVESA